MTNSPLHPTLLDVPISFFERNAATVPTQTTTLRQMVSTRHYAPQIEAIRAETDPTKQAELKRKLPAFTPVALLHHRKRDTSFAEKISQQWPMMMGDVDRKDNPNVDMVELKKHLARLPYLLLVAESVRGGLWFVVRLPEQQNPESLAAHFRYLQKVFSEKFGVALDSSKGGNPTALRFVSFDAAPYLNENATVLAGTYTPKPKSTPPRGFDYRREGSEDVDRLLTRLVRSTEAAAEGQRHVTLLKEARLAGGYVAAGRMDEQTAVYALENVASEWPNFTKSQKTIRDGIRYGLTAPVYTDERPARRWYPPMVGTMGATVASPPRPGFGGKTPTLKTEPVNPTLPIATEATEPSHQLNFFEWQRQHPDFKRLGLASLQHQ